MAFFDKNSHLWKELLNGNRDKKDEEERDSLHSAAKINRVLSAEESVRPSLRGVLSVKIRMVSLIKFDSSPQGANPTCTGGSHCTVTIRNLVKRTQVAQNNMGILKYDQTKHFPIQITRNRRHPYNMLKIELLSYSPNSTTHIVNVGSVAFHLHDIIRANPIAGTFDLWNDHMQVGDIDLEFTFSYGTFGYGYSPQLKEEDETAEEIVTYSLFPRVTPRRELREQDDPVMVVCAVPHPPFVNFKEKVHLSYGREIREQLESAAEGMYKPDVFEREMSAFDQVREEQEEVTVTLSDQVNLEGDTQHRVLVSKDYTRFVSSDGSSSGELDDRLSPRKRSPSLIAAGSGFFSGPSMGTIPSNPVGAMNMLATSALARKDRNSRSAQGVVSRTSMLASTRPAAPVVPSDNENSQLNVPGAWPK
ncbi:hypothetical protein CcCBS67573_g04720 [Chytriomyces confervae]|uniref:C2 domain-containing protein n=1 Tax=Chytriomyces confervae TaxID=246404 RepID=A0A507FCK2_9FUNG|nr:hypothetical protein CcCBS67573_g04720 [Chytriomyces confervae]